MFLAFSTSTFCQSKIEIYGGNSINAFHDYMSDEGHFQSYYDAGLSGYSAGIAIDNVQVDWLKMRFIFQFDKYDGKLVVTDGGLGGSYTTNASINKSVLSLGMFPINLKILSKLDFNLGFEV